MPIDKVSVNPWQPRTNFDHDKLNELAESIKKHGIIQPLVVTKSGDTWQLIAGERRLKAAQPKLWDFCLKLRRKEAVLAEIGSGRPFVHLSGRYPVERGCLAIVWPLAPHPTNKNELIVWDLAQDPRQLAGLDAETVRRRLYTRQDELPEGEQRLPIKTIHVNKSPIVIGNLKTLGGAAQRWGLDLDAAMENTGHARALGRALDALWPQVFTRPAEAQAPDVDEDLYGGFVGNEDRRTLQRLRELNPAQLAAKRPAFHDGRLEELLFRYRARNFPETLDEAGQARWRQHRVERLHGGAGGALTLAAFFERIDALAEAADERGQAILEALYDYAEGIAPEPS